MGLALATNLAASPVPSNAARGYETRTVRQSATMMTAQEAASTLAATSRGQTDDGGGDDAQACDLPGPARWKNIGARDSGSDDHYPSRRARKNALKKLKQGRR